MDLNLIHPFTKIAAPVLPTCYETHRPVAAVSSNHESRRVSSYHELCSISGRIGYRFGNSSGLSITPRRTTRRQSCVWRSAQWNTPCASQQPEAMVEGHVVDNETMSIKKKLDDSIRRKTIYLVDVHPLCYDGNRPNPAGILRWMKLLFDQVSLADPVIAVMDGERGNDYRRGLYPSYKKRRNSFRPLRSSHGPYIKGNEMDLREAFPYIRAFYSDCDVPVVKIHDAEADDVIATLMQQAVEKGMRVVVASPDMDYRQLLSQSVKMLLPLPDFGRWSFYTIQQYKTEHDCDPSADLSLRCMLGDQSDNIPGLPVWAPGFGRKTALKLMKKHGTLENLLLACQTKTVGRPYIQDALAQHRDALNKNLQLLSLRRDVDIRLKDDWCTARDRSNDVEAFRNLRFHLQERRSRARQ